MEDDEGGVHLRNLSMHLTTSEEDALNKLFLVRMDRNTWTTLRRCGWRGWLLHCDKRGGQLGAIASFLIIEFPILPAAA